VRILIVDDSPTMRRVLTHYLRRMGFAQVSAVSRGREALWSLYAGAPIDLIISDWLMPEMDGIELTHRVRSSPWSRIPILMVTSNAGDDSILEALEAGVSHYIIKPFSAEVLAARVRTLLPTRVAAS